MLAWIEHCITWKDRDSSKGLPPTLAGHSFSGCTKVKRDEKASNFAKLRPLICTNCIIRPKCLLVKGPGLILWSHYVRTCGSIQSNPICCLTQQCVSKLFEEWSFEQEVWGWNHDSKTQSWTDLLDVHGRLEVACNALWSFSCPRLPLFTPKIMPLPENYRDALDRLWVLFSRIRFGFGEFLPSSLDPNAFRLSGQSSMAERRPRMAMQRHTI